MARLILLPLCIALLPFNAAFAVAASDKYYCQHYAATAVKQNQKNEKNQCDFAGPRWSNDYTGQYQWCLTVRKSITRQEHEEREKLLQSCLTKSTSRYSKKNQISLPKACLDSSHRFIPIRSIYTRETYHAKAGSYRPIRTADGMIQADFNADKKDDYIFIERDSKDIQLAYCTSQSNKSYKRTVTPFKINANTENSTHVSLQRIKFKDDILTVTDLYHEHNWGSDGITSHYVFDPILNDFSLIQFNKSSTTGDGYRSNTFAEYDLVKKSYSYASTCGAYEAGCKNKSEKGRIELLKTPVTLSKKPLRLHVEWIPPYKRLIPNITKPITP